MNLEQLEYVIEVDKQGTISKAAEKLYISHSAISQSISNLESELGLIIFKRSHSGSICTEEGKKVLKLAYEVINKVREIKEVGYNTSMLKGTLKVSASSIFFTTLLPEILHSFKEAFPNVQLDISEDDVANIEKYVKNNEIDVGLTYVSPRKLKEIDPALTFHLLFQTKFQVCVSKNSSLANYKQVSPKEVVQFPLALRNENPGKNYWESLLFKFGKVDVFLYSNNNDVIRKVIADNLAIGIYTDFWVKQDPLIEKGDIIPIPFKLGPDSTLSLMYLLAKNKHVSLIENEFIKLLKQRFEEYSLQIL